MYFIIEYIDAFTGLREDAVFWEFARTQDEACLKAASHLPIVRAKFAAHGYRIIAPNGAYVAMQPGLYHDEHVSIVGLDKPLPI